MFERVVGDFFEDTDGLGACEYTNVLVFVQSRMCVPSLESPDP